MGTGDAAQRQIDAAKAICAGCPVRFPYLAWAVATAQPCGIFGGQTEDERRVRRCHHNRPEGPAAPVPGQAATEACLRVILPEESQRNLGRRRAGGVSTGGNLSSTATVGLPPPRRPLVWLFYREAGPAGAPAVLLLPGQSRWLVPADGS